MFIARKNVIVIIALVIFVFLLMWSGYYLLPKKDSATDINISTDKEIVPQIPEIEFPEGEEIKVIEEEETAELMETEIVSCNNETYIFDTVLLERKGFFNDIYKISRSSDNLIVRLKSPEENFFGIFSILVIPKKDCDRMYLTSHVWASDVPAIRIFEWQIGGKEARELAVSNEFASNYTSKDWISPNGEKIIIAQQTEPNEENFWCDHRTLRLLRLREDISEVLVQLPETETFDDGNSELSPYCQGLNFGFEDELTIYYDVYDATTVRNRPFLERRTLSIPDKQ